MKKTKYQKELEIERGNEDELNEYEENFIVSPEHGPYQSDPLFDIYYRFEFFSTLRIEESIKEFTAAIKRKKIDPSDFEKIENGIKSFTNSSTVVNKDLALLYKSILISNPDILINKLRGQEEYVQQLISEEYFESFDKLNSFVFPSKELISKKSLDIYSGCATYITKKRLKEWVKYSIDNDGDSSWADKYDQINIYRGINNKSYYINSVSITDFLSLYKNLDDDFPYFERNLLTSYTLSPNLAEKFMVGNPRQRSNRRVMVETQPEGIDGRILSSFLISPNFRDSQLEFICFPEMDDLKIRTELDIDLLTYFILYKE
jgi:hypothetical protein